MPRQPRVHPNKEIAKQFDDDMHNAVLMAEKLGIHQINCFSGCPGDCPESKNPNWVVCAWPNEFCEVVEWQWNEILIPYWKDFVAFAKAHGVNKIALEMHQGFCVYNTYTLKKLREAVGPEIGANLDPSHLIWQGMDPIKVIRALGGDAIFHVHAKDTKIDPINGPIDGTLDYRPYGDEIHRSWIFRSIGYGHDELFWKDFVSQLRLVGYDYVLSIEHEDSLMSKNEGPGKGLRRAQARHHLRGQDERRPLVLSLSVTKNKEASPHWERLPFLLPQKLPRWRSHRTGDVRKCPGRHHPAALLAAAGAHVDEVVGVAHHV